MKIEKNLLSFVGPLKVTVMSTAAMARNNTMAKNITSPTPTVTILKNTFIILLKVILYILFLLNEY